MSWKVSNTYLWPSGRIGVWDDEAENRRFESESWILLLNLSLLFSKHETLALQLLLVITRVIYPQITVSIL
jgi:hypothetical protein